MTTAAAVVALAAGALVARTSPRAAPAASAAVVVVLAAPAVALPLGVAAAAVVHRRRRRPEAGDADVALLAELVSLGLSAGLSFPEALANGASHVTTPLRTDVESAIRAGRGPGLSVALEHAGGPARPLYRAVARALRTGAPVDGAVRRLVEDLRAEERTKARERARRLPVKMLFPLALLILPGFLVVTIGPTLLAALDRFAL